MTMQIPQGPRDPVQNPVPNNPAARRVAYQQDPFEDPFGDEALVQQGTGQAYRQQGLGFGRRQQYQFDPFDQTTGTSASPGAGVEYTQRTSDVVRQEIAQEQEDDNAGTPPPPVDTPYAHENEYGGVAPIGGDVLDPITGENLGPSFVQGVEGDPGAVSSVTVGNPDFGYQETFTEENATQDVRNAIASGIDPEAAAWEAGFPQEEPGLVQRGTELVEQYAQPGTRETSWGTDFTTSPGGAVSAALPPGLGALAAIGGGISRANLERVHGRIEEDPEYGEFYAPGDIPGVDTPIAVHEGFIPGTRVVSGATDLIQGLPQDPHTGQNVTDAITIDAFAREAQQAEATQQERRRIEQERLAAERAAQEAADIAAFQEAEQQRLAAEAAERQRQAAEQARIQRENAERDRRQREAAEAARAEAARREEVRRANEELERQRQQDRDNERAQIQQGRAVTDRHGRAVRDSGGRIVTDRPSQRSDDGGGGGGDSCFAKGTLFRMADGSLKEIQDIKVGDHMDYGGRVYGVLQGDGNIEDWYAYGISYVTGSHFVLEDRWVPVEKSMAAERLIVGFDTWYCVLNEHHMMVAEDGTFFTDFDAVDSVNDELEERLNAVQE